MKVLLISTYELGRQPFSLASPVAWLQKAGASGDLSVQQLVKEADLIGLYLPMHTATRLASKVLTKVRMFNPTAHLCCYGLYAPMNADYLRKRQARA